MNPIPEKRWKRFERKVEDIVDGERVPMSGALEIEGSNVIETQADVWHPELFIEAKQRKVLPIWDEFKDIRGKARRYEKHPLLVIENPDDGYRLAAFDLEESLELMRNVMHGSDVWVRDVLNEFYLVHTVEKRNWCYPRWEEAFSKAKNESKPAMLALGKVNCPGALGVLGFP